MAQQNQNMEVGDVSVKLSESKLKQYRSNMTRLRVCLRKKNIE